MEVREDSHDVFAPGESHRGLFGDWGDAPIAKDWPLIPVPLLNTCEFCRAGFVLHPASEVLSTGILVPSLGKDGVLYPAYYHRVCWFKFITNLEEE